MNEPTTHTCATEDAIHRGRQAFERGEELDANPFRASLDLRAAWDAGWKLQEAEGMIRTLNERIGRLSGPQPTWEFEPRPLPATTSH